MGSTKNELTTEQDLLFVNQNYLEMYGGFFILFLMVLSNFNLRFCSVYFLDYITHVLLLWYFENKRIGGKYSYALWAKKFMIIPLHHYALGPTSLIPGWCLTMTQIVTLSNTHLDITISDWKAKAYLLILTESAFTMHFFMGYTIRTCLVIFCLTLFFILYILNILISVRKLVKESQEQYLRYKNLVSYIHGVIFTMDENLNISYVNKGILNLQPKDIMGKNLSIKRNQNASKT
eukprot:gene9863-2185_t